MEPGQAEIQHAGWVIKVHIASSHARFGLDSPSDRSFTDRRSVARTRVRPDRLRGRSEPFRFTWTAYFSGQVQPRHSAARTLQAVPRSCLGGAYVRKYTEAMMPSQRRITRSQSPVVRFCSELLAHPRPGVPPGYDGRRLTHSCTAVEQRSLGYCVLLLCTFN